MQIHNSTEGMIFMNDFRCDYGCKTVEEGITKYNIPNDWCAQFDAYNDVYPLIYIQVEQIRKNSALMDLKLRIVENEEEEYPGCMIFTDKKTIAFKVDYMSDLIKAMEIE